MGEEVKIRFGVDGISEAISQIKQLGSSISGMAKEFAAPLAAIATVAGISDLAKQFQEYNLQVEKAAQFTGMSAGEVAGLGYAAQRSDTSLEALQQGLKAFSKWLVETGQGSKNLHEAILEQADFFQQLGDGAQRNELAVERFGKSGMDLIPVLSRGSAALQDLIERGRDLSGVTDASVKTAREYADSWTDLKVSAEAFVGTAWSKLQPSLAGLFDNLSGGMIFFRKLIDNTDEASDAFSNLASKKIAGLWTESELDVQSKMLDQQRASLQLLMQRRDIMSKGMDSYSQGKPNDPFHADLGTLKAEADIIDKKLTNASQALAQHAITQNQYDQINLETKKELLAIDERRQAIEQLDVSSAMKDAELDMQKLQHANALVNADFTKTASQKRTEEIQILQRESDRLQQLLDGMKKSKETNPEVMGPVLQEGIDNATKQKQGVDQQLALKTSTPDPNSFKDQWQKMLTEIEGESSVTWAKIAETMHTTVGTAVESLSQNMTKIVMGTESWRQGLVSIGQAIETQIIGKIISMAAEAVLEWLPAAVLSSIASDGESAGSGLAAVLSAMTGFADGGYTGAGGKYDVAGVVHSGEYVMPADTVQRLGLPYMESIRQSGGGSPSSSGTKLAGGVTNVHLWGLEEAMNQHLRNNSDAENHVMRIVKKNAHKVFPRQA